MGLMAVTLALTLPPAMAPSPSCERTGPWASKPLPETRKSPGAYPRPPRAARVTSTLKRR